MAREGSFKTIALTEDGEQQVIGGSIGRDHDHLEMLGRRQASDRVLLFLHGLVERYRALGRPDDELVLSMSRDDIASYLGLVIETVSRVLGRLQNEGVIAVRTRHVRILDPTQFSGLAHSASPPSRKCRGPRPPVGLC